MRLSKDVRISVSVVAARETRLFTLTALALTRTLTHGSKRWNMHCICRFESPYSWRVGSTEHFLWISFVRDFSLTSPKGQREFGQGDTISSFLLLLCSWWFSS